MARKNKKNLAILAICLAFALWGLNTPLIKTSLLTVPLFPLLAAKYALGGFVFTLLSYRQWKPLSNKLKINIFLATLFGYVLTTVLTYKGIQLTGGLNTSLLLLVSPFILYFSSIRFLKEKFNTKLLTGVMIGFLGSILIISAPLLTGAAGSSGNLLGNLLVICAIGTDTCGTILIKRALHRASPMQVTAIRFNVAAFCLLPLGFTEIQGLQSIAWDTTTIMAVGYNLFFATIIAYGLYHWALRRLSGEQISPLFYLDPLVGAVGSVIILREQPTTIMVLGVVLIALGLYFSESVKLHRYHRMSHAR